MANTRKDRRKNTRVSLELAAELQLSEHSAYTGKTGNISFSGIYMLSIEAAKIPVGATGMLKLHLQAGPAPNAIAIRCQVVRTDESGAGIRFIHIDIEGYRQFKNLMAYNSPDPDTLLAELAKHPGLEIYKGP
jgi:c-di-GMP-binding flagellar brake protein YcgR